MRHAAWLLALGLGVTPLFCACGDPPPEVCRDPGAGVTCSKLQSYALLPDSQAALGLAPAPGLLPFAPGSALFSDYALKYRYVYLPRGQSARYDESGVFDFPVGTILVKSFAYPADLREPSPSSKSLRLIETRLLFRRAAGWDALPYVWNDEQTEATLRPVGAVVDVSWVHTDGQRRSIGYVVPNLNQCKECHEDAAKVMAPIGPKARHLNHDYPYPEGPENQLARWARTGALSGAPAPDSAPRLPVWSDEQSGSLPDRARAWLEINCAHCHNPQGGARTTGLDLQVSQQSPYQYGVCKPPVAAGKGTGGREFGIVPGKPDESILQFRIESTAPGVMMPETGRQLPHAEGIALVRAWIQGMAMESCRR